MTELLDVQDHAQQIAEAISSVLKIDVEIADQNLIRVAGTGGYRAGVGKSMDRQGYVYREVLNSGRAVTIDCPGFHELCVPCPHHNQCPEKFEIVYPINNEGKTFGAIGLLCMTDENAEFVRKNQESYGEFLGKMAENLSLKLKEKEFTDRLVLSNRYLVTVLNCLEEGLVTADITGKIMHCNLAAQAMFKNTPIQPETTLYNLLGNHIADEVLNLTNNEVLEREVLAGSKKDRVPLVMGARLTETDRGAMNLIITFKRLSELSRMVYHLSTAESSYTIDDILGSSESMCRVREQAKVIAASQSTILIGGESGTGKEMLARAIHNMSPRRQAPFVAINCSAIPETLLESELFGYEEGAFTGACKGGKLGKFQLANHGTLFLDEIGDMPLFLQSKLLRVLQERQIDRIGGLQPTPIDVRIIAATHRNLEEMMREGEFREDLYYRINVIPTNIAPLRDRKEDLEELFAFFISKYNQQLNKNVQGMSDEFINQLRNYSWPGNVRELSNVIEYAMNLTQGDRLEAEHLPVKIKQHHSMQNTDTYNLYELERKTILDCLKEHGYSVQGKEAAAGELGIGLATLYRKLAQYDKNDRLSK